MFLRSFLVRFFRFFRLPNIGNCDSELNKLIVSKVHQTYECFATLRSIVSLLSRFSNLGSGKIGRTMGRNTASFRTAETRFSSHRPGHNSLHINQPNFFLSHDIPAPKTSFNAENTIWYPISCPCTNERFLPLSLNIVFTPACVSFTYAGGVREHLLRHDEVGLASTFSGRVVDATATGVGGEECRHKLRVQMNIERKRARLFQDIQMLPYTWEKDEMFLDSNCLFLLRILIL